MADEVSTEVLDPFNRINERALINLLTPEFQNYVLRAHAARPDLFGLDERELENILWKEDKQPRGTDNALRVKFWFEYDEAQAERRRMKVVNIWRGVCEDRNFFTFLAKPEKVAWLLTRPQNYEIRTQEMHEFSLRQLRKILEESCTANGKFNVSLARTQVEIFKILDDRVMGAVVQKTLNVHSSVPGKQMEGTDAQKREELERRLVELEREREKERGKIIDASPVPTE